MNSCCGVATANGKNFFSVSSIVERSINFKIFWVGIPSHPTTYFCSSQLKSSASYYYTTESRKKYSDFKYGETEDTMNLDGGLS